MPITQTQLDRINELYKKYKEGTLTPEESIEREQLKKTYVAAVRASLRGQLDNISLVNPDGSITDLKERHDKKYPGDVNGQPS